jgi:UDP-N-acetylmuramate dehydrogenase
MNKDLIDKLKGIEGIELLIDKDLFRYTTMRLHVRGDLAIVKTRNALRNVIRLLNENQYPYNLVGWGANQIIVHPDHTLFIQLDFPFDRSTLDTTHDEYILPASTPLNILTSHAKKFGLMGWEVFTGIPASLGGAIFMNAGTNLGEISEIVKEVEVLKKDGSLVLHQVDEHSFSYRKCHFVNKGDIILSAKLVHKGKSPEIKSKISEYIALRKKNTAPFH